MEQHCVEICLNQKIVTNASDFTDSPHQDNYVIKLEFLKTKNIATQNFDKENESIVLRYTRNLQTQTPTGFVDSITTGPEDIKSNSHANQYTQKSVTNNDDNAATNIMQDKDKYLCNTCKIIFTSNSPFQSHLKHCHKQKGASITNKKHKCNECNYQTDKFHSLWLHKLTHSAAKRFTCTLCNKGFNRCDTYRHHMFEHENQRKPFQCKQCNYSAISRSHLKSHIGYKHLTKKPLQCGICSYRCVTTSVLKCHMLTHTGHDMKIKCDQCDYWAPARRKRDLLKHIKRKHCTDRPFQCDCCDYKTVSASVLRQHSKNKHSQDKRYKCSACTYQTMIAGDYARHVERKHTGTGQLFECKVCDFKTAYKSSLKNHERTVHFVEKSFGCNRCSYKCATAEYLKRHIHVHDEIKPLKCGECKYQTLTVKNLAQHVATRHLRQQ